MTNGRPDAEAAAPVARKGFDLAGVSIWVAAVAWTQISASSNGSRPGPTTGMIAGVGLTFIVARAVASRWPLVVPILVVGATLLVLASNGWNVLHPLGPGGPLGYANAAAVQAVLASTAALGVAVAARGILRIAAAVVAAALATIPLVDGTIAAAVSLAIPAGCLVAVSTGRRSAAAALCPAIVAAAVLGSVIVAANSPASLSPGEGHVGSRVALWHDAFQLMTERPLVGFGPGSFPEESSIARADPDAAQAHNEFLQQGAEQGVVGFVILVLAIGWAFLWLWFRCPSTALAVFGAAALTVASLNGCVDYVLRFPTVTLAAAAMVGSAGARAELRGGRRPDAPQEPSAKVPR